MWNVGAAVTVVGVMLTFWVGADSRSSKLADSLDALRIDSRNTRDMVMEIKGQLFGLAASLTGGETDREQIHDQLKEQGALIRAQDIRIRELERGR